MVKNTQLNKPTNQNSVNVPKVAKPTNKKTFLNFGDKCNKETSVSDRGYSEKWKINLLGR